MKKLIASIILASLLIMTLASCGGNSIVGTWTADSVVATEYTFNADGTGSRSVAGVTQAFNYTLDGETLKVTYQIIGGISNSEEYKVVLDKDTLTMGEGSLSLTLKRK